SGVLPTSDTTNEPDVCDNTRIPCAEPEPLIVIMMMEFAVAYGLLTVTCVVLIGMVPVPTGPTICTPPVILAAVPPVAVVETSSAVAAVERSAVAPFTPTDRME